jgi:hypothetical protein
LHESICKEDLKGFETDIKAMSDGGIPLSKKDLWDYERKHKVGFPETRPILKKYGYGKLLIHEDKLEKLHESLHKESFWWESKLPKSAYDVTDEWFVFDESEQYLANFNSKENAEKYIFNQKMRGNKKYSSVSIVKIPKKDRDDVKKKLSIESLCKEDFKVGDKVEISITPGNKKPWSEIAKGTITRKVDNNTWEIKYDKDYKNTDGMTFSSKNTDEVPVGALRKEAILHNENIMHKEDFKVGDKVKIPSIGTLGGNSKIGKVLAVNGKKGVGYGVVYDIQFVETGQVVKGVMATSVFPESLKKELYILMPREDIKLGGKKITAGTRVLETNDYDYAETKRVDLEKQTGVHFILEKESLHKEIEIGIGDWARPADKTRKGRVIRIDDDGCVTIKYRDGTSETIAKDEVRIEESLHKENEFWQKFDVDALCNNDAEVMRMVKYLEKIKYADPGEIGSDVLNDGDAVASLFETAIYEKGFKPNAKFLRPMNKKEMLGFDFDIYDLQTLSDARIKQVLAKLGLTTTGKKDKDIANIRTKMSSMPLGAIARLKEQSDSSWLCPNCEHENDIEDKVCKRCNKARELINRKMVEKYIDQDTVECDTCHKRVPLDFGVTEDNKDYCSDCYNKLIPKSEKLNKLHSELKVVKGDKRFYVGPLSYRSGYDIIEDSGKYYLRIMNGPFEIFRSKPFDDAKTAEVEGRKQCKSENPALARNTGIESLHKELVRKEDGLKNDTCDYCGKKYDSRGLTPPEKKQGLCPTCIKNKPWKNSIKEARTIGASNITLVKNMTKKMLKQRKDPLTGETNYQGIDEEVINALPEELWDTWEAADQEIRRIIGDVTSAWSVGRESLKKEVATPGFDMSSCMTRMSHMKNPGAMCQYLHEKYKTGKIKNPFPGD